MAQRPIFAHDPSRGIFAMAVGGQTIELWKLSEASEEGEAAGMLETGQTTLVGMVVAGDGRLVTVHQAGLMLGWDLDSAGADEPEQVWKYDAQMKISAMDSHRSEDGNTVQIAIGGEQGEVAIGHLDGEGRNGWATVARGHRDKVEVLSFSEDGQRLASAARDRDIAIWGREFVENDEEQTLHRIRTLSGSGGWPMALSFSGDRRKLVSGCMDNGVYLWDLEADEALQATRFDHHGWVEDVAWAGDDEAIVSASWDGTVGVFRADPLAPQFQFSYHDDYVVCVLPVTGSPLVFAASYDEDVTVWDWRRGRLEAILEGHGDWVTDLVDLGEGTVVSLSSDRTARLWSTDDFSSRGMMGEPAVEGFELGGGLDLASFGLGEDRSRLDDDSGPDLESLQPQVVRRFEDTDPFSSAGSQDTAMSMLEEAVDRSETIDAEVVDEAAGGADALEDAPTGLGDELSSMVLDAISDVEEEEEEEQPPPGEESEEIETGEVDAPDADSEAEKGEDEEISDALDMLGTPDIETAKASDLEGGEGADEISSEISDAWSQMEVPESDEVELGAQGTPDDVELSSPERGGARDQELGGEEGSEQEASDGWTDREMPETGEIDFDVEEPVEDVELDVEEPAEDVELDVEEPAEDVEFGAESSGEEEASAEELADQAFEDVDDDVDIMDSLFDPVEQPTEQTEPSAPSEADDESDPVPTSGPMYDPKPVGDDDEIDELLPDDDMLDLAFSSSFGEIVDAPDGGEQADAAPTEDEASKGEKDSDSDVDPSDGERGPPGKASPSSADGGATDEADDGEQNPWKKARRSTTLTSGKPLAADEETSDDAGESTSEAAPASLRDRLKKAIASKSSTPAGDGDESPSSDSSDAEREQFGNRTLTPFVSEAQEHSTGPADPPADQSRGDQSGKEGSQDKERPGSLPEGMRSQLAEKLGDKLAQKASTPKQPKEQAPKEGGGDPAAGQSPKQAATEGKKAPKKKTKTAVGGRPAVSGKTGAGSAPKQQKQKAEKKAKTAGGKDSPGSNEAGAAENARRPQKRRKTKQRRRTAVGGRPRPEAVPEPTDKGGLKGKTPTSAREEKSEESRDSDRVDTVALKLDAEVGDLEVGDEDTIGAVDDRQSPASSKPASSQNVETRSQSRLTPGEKTKREELQVPDVDEDGASSTDERASVQFVELELGELWQRATASAPKMGILKRKTKLDDEYRPFHQRNTGHQGTVSVAVSPGHKRLVTAGTQGKIDIVSIKNQKKTHFECPGCTWKEVGFIEGESFFYGLDGRGKIHLWLLPKGVFGEVTRVSHAVIEAPSTEFRCARLVDGGEKLLTGSAQGLCQLWSLKSGKCLVRLKGHKTEVSAVSVGKKGPITASVDGQIRFWNWQGLQLDQVGAPGEIRDLTAWKGRVVWVETSGALCMMAEGSSKGVRLQGHHGQGRTVAFRNDGRFVSAGEDGRLLMYDAKKQELIQEIHVPAPVQKVALTSKILAASSAGAVLFVFRRNARKKKS